MRSNGPNPPLGLAVLRIVTGVVFVAHGATKLFGGGVPGTADFLASLGIPAAGLMAWVVAALEFFGGLALVVGLLVTPIAVLFCIHMLLGIILVHAPNGFFVIGPGQGGIELNLMLIASLVTLIFAGPGMAAIGGGSESEVVHAGGPAGEGTVGPAGETAGSAGDRARDDGP